MVGLKMEGGGGGGGRGRGISGTRGARTCCPLSRSPELFTPATQAMSEVFISVT